ncbi:MAG: helix-turn-helix domain-containing protein [Candidatus Schekmanbacteria bacterium]|nr:helix-turn-helix domain-containing protein [Candidatus Schekmanbacteria bacterium]
MAERDPWASVEDVAKHLGIAKDTVYRWLESKVLPAHKIGRLWKLKLTEVDEWGRSRGATEGEPTSTRVEETSE